MNLLKLAGCYLTGFAMLSVVMLLPVAFFFSYEVLAVLWLPRWLAPIGGGIVLLILVRKGYFQPWTKDAREAFWLNWRDIWEVR